MSTPTMEKRPACPPTLNWVSTYLTLENPTQAVDFYTRVFGFEVKEVRYRKDTDRILFARLTHNGSDIIMGPQAAFGGRTGSVAPIVSSCQSPIVMYVYCEDVDALYEKVKQEPFVEIVTEINTTFWGDRVFKMQCPEGYYWDFATNIQDPDLELSHIAVD